MRKVGPIQFWRGCMINLKKIKYKKHPKSLKQFSSKIFEINFLQNLWNNFLPKSLKQISSKIFKTILGGQPMRGRDMIMWPKGQWGLKKSVERRQTNKERNRHKDILTTRKNWTKGRFFEKKTVLNWTPSEKTKSRTCHPQKCPRMSQTLVILGVASSRLYHFLGVASPWLSHFRGWPFQNSVVFFMDSGT